MEHAGQAVARFVLRELPHCRRVAVLCGKGNNGGDGFVSARHLSEVGYSVSVVVLGNPAEIQGDAKAMLQLLPKPAISITDEAELERQLQNRGFFKVVVNDPSQRLPVRSDHGT